MNSHAASAGVIVVPIERSAWPQFERKEEGHKSGIVEGKRDTLLRLLARAGITLTGDDRARVQACKDAAILDRWVDNVFGAKTAAEVLS